MSDPLARHLLPGETVLWTGHPLPGLTLRPVDGLLIPFSLVWAVFVIAWNLGVWRIGAPAFFRLWGLPFLAVGLHLALGRFVLDAWLLRQRRYAVTDRRVLILRGRDLATVTALDLRRLPALELAERPDGSGTIRLALGGGGGWDARRGPGPWHAALDPVPQLLRIPDARSVRDLIQRQAAA